MPIVYTAAYNITAFGLERYHPFDSVKYRRISQYLIRQGLRKPKDFLVPPRCTRSELLAVHPPAYLRSLRQRRQLAKILEIPLLASLPAWLLDWRILSPMRRATAGTILACRRALEQGVAINLAGGYHHAAANAGGGFCVYADVPIALAVLHKERKLKSALVVDTDAHQGNGTADAIRPWSWAALLDFYEDDIFPWPKVAETMPVPLMPRTNNEEYLDLLREHVPQALERYRPELVVYNAGSDVLWSDPLSALMLTADGLADRDLYVITECRDRGIPVALVLSGGYGPHSWEAHARSIEGILARFDKAT